MREIIQKILETAVYAPSGDNSQPWRFEVRGNIIDLFNVPGSDNPLLNFRQRGSFIAHGAVIENIVILASVHGYKVEVQLLPDLARDHVARLALVTADMGPDPLHKYIESRSTNRHFYKNQQLTAEQRRAIEQAAALVSEAKLFIQDGAAAKKELGAAAGLNEVIMLETKEIAESFFERVVWTAKEEQDKKAGLYVATFEFNPIQIFLFKLMKIWGIARVLNKLGIARFIAKQNSKQYASGSAICAIVVEDSDKGFITAGRMLQRVWLKIEGMGWGLHPMAGIVYFAHQVNSGEDGLLSAEHATMAKEAYVGILKNFSIGNGVVGMMFRIGEAPKPSARSSKKTPAIIYVN